MALSAAVEPRCGEGKVNEGCNRVCQDAHAQVPQDAGKARARPQPSILALYETRICLQLQL